MTDTSISISDFRDFVFNDIPVFFEETTRGGEIAFEHKLGNGYSVVIITSITKGEKYIRKNDSIKIIVLDDSNELVEAKPHTKRTEGFRERVIEKVESIIHCPECSESVKVSVGEYGPYYFCTNDTCEYTESI